MKNKLKTFLIGLAVGSLLLFTWISPTLQAHDSIIDELLNRGVGYIYIYNREDSSPDVITIFSWDEKILEIICSVDGVTKIFVNDTEYKCNSK